MLHVLARLNDGWRARGLPGLRLGIGVHSGEAVIGDFGSSKRFSYTAVGDDVNLAARLEGPNARYGTNLLVTESTRRVIGANFVCREIDRVRVRGRAAAVGIHEVLAGSADDEERLVRRARAFEAALRSVSGPGLGRRHRRAAPPRSGGSERRRDCAAARALRPLSRDTPRGRLGRVPARGFIAWSSTAGPRPTWTPAPTSWWSWSRPI
jgi:hypothetical protein